MPLLQSDPLSDPTLSLNPGVNPYVDRIKDVASSGALPIVFGPSLKDRYGKWNSQIPGTQKVVLEVGCHKGTVLIPMALDHPHWHVIGCDITFKRVMLTAERLKAKGANNSTVIYANAKALDKVFAPSELDGLLIFFPDPWSKKAHQLHKRLIDSEFVTKLVPLLKSGAFVWIKTDSLDYFQEIAALLDMKLSRTDNLTSLNLKDYQSSYELRFKAGNVMTYQGLWQQA